MRWRPIILDLALIVAVWTLLLWLLRVQRARMGAAPSPRAKRGYRMRTATTIAAALGFTCFSTWLITDATGPHWLHSLSLPRHSDLPRKRCHLGGMCWLAQRAVVRRGVYSIT